MTKRELEVIGEEAVVLVAANLLLKKYGCETIRGAFELIRDRVAADTDLDAAVVKEWAFNLTSILGELG